MFLKICDVAMPTEQLLRVIIFKQPLKTQFLKCSIIKCLTCIVGSLTRGYTLMESKSSYRIGFLKFKNIEQQYRAEHTVKRRQFIQIMYLEVDFVPRTLSQGEAHGFVELKQDLLLRSWSDLIALKERVSLEPIY